MENPIIRSVLNVAEKNKIDFYVVEGKKCVAVLRQQTRIE